MLNKLTYVAIALLIAASLATRAAAAQDALVLLHGKVWTGNPQQPEAEAVALRANQIVAVGNVAAVLAAAGPNPKIIELGGRRVVPGFNDAHVHFMDGGDSLVTLDTRDAASAAEFRDRVAAYTHTLEDGEWVRNGNWDHERWPGAQLPTHVVIDSATGGHPAFLWRTDGHMALANALAMRLAGVDRNTPDVAGGVIVRDAEGNPTGIFKDAATALISRAVPPLTTVQMERALDAAMRYAAANGVTSVQDLAGSTTDTREPAFFREYQQMERAGKLTVRIATSERLLDWQPLAAAGITAGFGNAGLRTGGVKGFADGALGSRTAWMLQPFSDSPAGAPDQSGIPSDELLDDKKMYADILGADRAGLQVMIHAIGDRANRTILDLYERAEAEDGPRDRRFRIEHVQHLDPADLPRFAKLHVIASMQPYHEADDGRWASNRLGPERSRLSYAWRSLLDSGAVLAFGSDWPVAPMEPLKGIYAAVTRRTIDGRNPEGWIPEQRITVAEALHAYTVSAAYAEFQEKVKGSIEPGKLADVVVLSIDILHATPDELGAAKVDMTIFDGRVIYDRNAPHP
ncbi:MAG TPA: amidohydrolase [Acidisarcina sp.]